MLLNKRTNPTKYTLPSVYYLFAVLIYDYHVLNNYVLYDIFH